MRGCFFAVFFLFACSVCMSQLQRFSFTEPKMGSPLTIIFYHPDSMQAAATAKKCFALVDSLVNIFSDYIDSSELNRLCAQAGTGRFVACSPALFDILLQSRYAYQNSKGRFDITLGPVTRLWRKARKENTFPSASAVHEKLLLTGFKKIQFDTATHAVRLAITGMQLDLGGIGQGYIAQRVIDYLNSAKIDQALVNVSGDIVCSGSPPGAAGWTVAINMPESETELLPRHLLISHRAVTTSGDVYQYMEHNHKRYSHIVDPSTGYGITSQRNVTVIAADGTTADWLTKACSILPMAEAKQLAQRLHAEVLIAAMSNGRPVLHASKGFAGSWEKNRK